MPLESVFIAWCAIYPKNRTRNYLRFIRELINKPDWSYLIVVRKVYPGSLVRHLVCPWLWVGQNFYQAITHRLYCLLHLLFNSLLLHMSNIEGLNTSFRWRWNRSPLTIQTLFVIFKITAPWFTQTVDIKSPLVWQWILFLPAEGWVIGWFRSKKK